MLYLASYPVKSIFLTSVKKFYTETMQYRATALIFQNLVITSKSFTCIHLDSALCTSHSSPNIVQEPMYHLAIALEKAMATHSSTLAWKIPWVEEPGRLQFMGSLRVGHDWATSLSLFTFMHWRRKWQPTPVFLPGESQGQGSLVGCCLWGRTESDTTEATAAAAAIALQYPWSIDSRIPVDAKLWRFLNPDIKWHSEVLCVLVTQSCPFLCNPMDCSPSCFPVHGVLQARILQWVAMPSSRGSSWPRDWTWVTFIEGRFFTNWATREALSPQYL